MTNRNAVMLLAGVALLGLTSHRSPIYTKAEEGVNHDGAYLANNIVDERLWYNPSNGLLNYDRQSGIWPKIEWLVFGNTAREENQKVTIFAAIGLYGYYAGPGVHVLDPHGLSDPLMARLPIKDAAYLKPGHYVRQVPIGYKKSVETGLNHIADPYLAELYDKLRIVTQGGIFSPSRLYEIAKFNLGIYDTLIELYRRPHRLQIHLADFSEPKAAGSYWADYGNIILDSFGVDITLDSIRTSPQVELSHDHNDKYCLQYFRGDSLIVIDTIPLQNNPTGGLSVTRTAVPLAAIACGYERIRITGAEGDGMYSVGHLQLIADTTAP
jgi:arabinofuranosyltransferase